MCPQFLLVLVISFFRWKASATSQYMSIKRALGQMWFCAVSSLSEVWEASNWLTGQKSYRDCYKPTSSSEELELAFSWKKQGDALMRVRSYVLSFWAEQSFKFSTAWWCNCSRPSVCTVCVRWRYFGYVSSVSLWQMQYFWYTSQKINSFLHGLCF